MQERVFPGERSDPGGEGSQSTHTEDAAHSPPARPATQQGGIKAADTESEQYTTGKTHEVQVTGNGPLSLSSYVTLKGIWKVPQWG